MTILFEAGWSDYEECGYRTIFEENGQLFCREEGHCVMAEDNSPSTYPVTQEQAMQIMLDWSEHEDVFEAVTWPYNWSQS
jgi:hypothetical protein